MPNDHNWRTRLTRWGKLWYLRIMRQRASAHSIALGVALGVFVGALPIIPFQSITVLTLAFICRANKVAAFFSTFYSNVFTMVPFYYLLYLIGDFLLPFKGVHIDFDPNKLSMEALLNTGWQAFSIMLAGGFIFGVVAGVGSYFPTLWLVRRYRTHRALRLLRKRTGG